MCDFTTEVSTSIPAPPIQLVLSEPHCKVKRLLQTVPIITSVISLQNHFQNQVFLLAMLY